MKPMNDQASVAASNSGALDECSRVVRSGLSIASGRRASARVADRKPPGNDACASPAGGTSDPTRPDADFADAMTSLLPRLRNFASKFNAFSLDVDDVVQSACERAMARHEQFQTGTHFDSWMFRIVQTICLDEMRAARRMPSIDHTNAIARLPTDDRTLERIDAIFSLTVLRDAIAELPPDQRIVLALIVTEEMSYQEVADYLKIPVGTVMSRLSRSRRKLRLSLSPEVSVRAASRA